MKILYITQTLPYPLYSGGHIKTFSTLKKLVGEKHKITLCAFVTNEKYLNYQQELNKLGIKIGTVLLNNYITADIGRINKKLLFLRGLFSFKPFTVYKYYDPEFMKQIIQISAKNSFDCIWIDQLNMAQYLPKNFSGQKVLETQNIDSLFFKRMAMIDSNLPLRLFAIYEWLKYFLYEKVYFSKFNRIYAISDFDKHQIEKIANRKDIEIISPKLQYKNQPKQKRLKNTLLFVGSLYWYPNRDGLKWYLEKIYPEIQKKIPDIKFWIVGEIHRDFQNLKTKGVTFFGFQKNIEKFYRTASLFIVPIRYGSGVRLKILEALSYNLPIISTAQGVEGLDKKYFKKVQIVNDEREFVEKISGSSDRS